MSKKKKDKETDPKAKLAKRVERATKYLGKQKASAPSDPKRRKALKMVKRAQRRLGKVVAAEKRVEAAKAKAKKS